MEVSGLGRVGRSKFLTILILSVWLFASLTAAQTQNTTAMPTKKHKDNLGMETAHGFLLWVSMGFLMPLAIIVIRMSRLCAERGESTQVMKVLFYVHVGLQLLAFVFLVIGAAISLKYFGNKFRHTHHRLGLALYLSAWLSPIIGFLRPRRGTLSRGAWYFSHWLFGHFTVILGFVNIYIGLTIHEKHEAKSQKLWNVLFSIQIAIMGAIYLMQDRWTYMVDQSRELKPVKPSKVVDDNPVIDL